MAKARIAGEENTMATESNVKVTPETFISNSIAIDILLDPDARMVARAEANNARLLKAFPGGFALDAEHRPRVHDAAMLRQCDGPRSTLQRRRRSPRRRGCHRPAGSRASNTIMPPALASAWRAHVQGQARKS